LIVFCLIFHFKKSIVDYAFDVVLMYGILIFAYHPKLQISSFYKAGDFSYGLYIYAFPIQQLIALMLPTVMPLTNFIYTIPLALALAVPSWYFVEKPLLALKNRKII
jgi:peptidoglycan/LPS O-acetylase OafA/YrhL